MSKFGRKGEPNSVGYFLLESVEEHPKRTFMTGFLNGLPVSRSYDEAALAVANVAAAMRKVGLGKGSTIVTRISDVREAVFLNLACYFAGIVPVRAPGNCSMQYLSSVLEKIRPDALAISSTDSLREFGNGRRVLQFDSAHELLRVDGDLHTKGIGNVDYFSYLTELNRAIEIDDTLCVVPTSGSTGTPKFIERSHKARIFGAKLRSFNLTRFSEEHQRVLLLHSLDHGIGCGLLILSLIIGGELCTTSLIDIQASLTEVVQLKPTFAYLAPRVLSNLLSQSKLENEPELFGGQLRFLLVGGAAADQRVLQRYADHGVTVVDVYGSTEMGLVAMTTPGEWVPSCVGPLCPGVEVRFGADGELFVKAPGSMKGLLGVGADGVGSVMSEGFIKSGDLAELDERGRLRILSRKSDAFQIIDGTLVFPTRLEELLESEPTIRQAIVVGENKPFVSAFLVVNREGLSVTEEDGFLDRVGHADIYREYEARIDVLNRGLEPGERVGGIALFCSPFPSECYSVRGAAAKLRRGRAEFKSHYSKRIADVYLEGSRLRTDDGSG
jgi:long-subunit acyl-CoA synthetase (AMP-forming)